MIFMVLKKFYTAECFQRNKIRKAMDLPSGTDNIVLLNE